MPISPHRCVLVVKTTAFAQGGRAARLARRGDATARRLLPAHTEHERTLDVVRRALQSHGFPFDEVRPERLAAEHRLLARADLVVTVGGDGTVLAASHYVTSGVLLGVNSAPADSIGHFCTARRSDIGQCLDDVLAGKRPAARLTRLRLALDGRPVREPALNDLLFAHACPAATTRYVLTVGGDTEEHRSSGIWVATAAGSTAGIHSAGGRVLPLGSRRFQYLVRELYREPGRSYGLPRGMIAPGESLQVASKMREARIYVDGARLSYPFPFGTRAVIRIAEEPLRIVLPGATGGRGR